MPSSRGRPARARWGGVALCSAAVALGAATCACGTAQPASRAQTRGPVPVRARAPEPTPLVEPAAPPPFSYDVEPVSAADLPFTYRAGCPVGPEDLRAVSLGYWGFDGRAHTGRIVVDAAVAGQVAQIFGTLYEERFPIREMTPEDAFGANDPASMAADNTSGFNCRYAVAPGLPQWSEHAYGDAIDVNPVENPYLEAGTVQPPAGSAYVDRSELRPGMAVPGGQLVAAFAAAGWKWGGSWSSPDFQHFSLNGH